MKRFVVAGSISTLLAGAVVAALSFSGSTIAPIQAQDRQRVVTGSQTSEQNPQDQKQQSADNQQEPSPVAPDKTQPVTETENTADDAAASPAQSFVATAYSLRGRTASGAPVRKGHIAADRRVLPLGTRVRLEAGNYSGEYVVADTGGMIKGRRLDIWVPSSNEAMRFGRRNVKVVVLTRRVKPNANKITKPNAATTAVKR